MLTELSIRDFAIIDDLTLSFGAGFTVFSGETGAGKSIIVDAVETLVGGRADTTMIRSGAQTALIEGIFRVDPAIRDQVIGILEREDLLDDPDIVHLGREIRAQGRSISRINGRSVTLATQRELGEWLVDLHGQSDHLSLLRVSEHIHLLDRFAGVGQLKHRYSTAYRSLLEVRKELTAIQQRETEAARRAELLAYQVEEIETARLEPGETDQLREERTRLANAERLTHKADRALLALEHAGEQGVAAIDFLGDAAQALRELAEIDPSMERVRDEGQVAVEMAGQLARDLRSYLEAIEFDVARLEEVEERLGMIQDLQRKYGEGIEAILAYADAAREELADISTAQDRSKELRSEEARLLAQLAMVGLELSDVRRQAARDLGQGIEAALAELRMQEARFGVDLRREEDETGLTVNGRKLAFGPSGIDQVEFTIEPNPGEGLKPLAKIASGGETSRLMLGLKSVLAQADRTPMLIFDEIDQGIGGRVGSVVGRRLWELARDHQVLCITHLPQLAAFGDQHYRVEKAVQEGRTVTSAASLGEDERRRELASMLGAPSSANLESAADLMAKVAELKAAAAVGD